MVHECFDTEDLLNRTQIAQVLRSTINKCNLMKLISFCKAKDTINKQLRECVMIFADSTPAEELRSKIYRKIQET